MEAVGQQGGERDSKWQGRAGELSKSITDGCVEEEVLLECLDKEAVAAGVEFQDLCGEDPVTATATQQEQNILASHPPLPPLPPVQTSQMQLQRKKKKKKREPRKKKLMKRILQLCYCDQRVSVLNPTSSHSIHRSSLVSSQKQLANKLASVSILFASILFLSYHFEFFFIFLNPSLFLFLVLDYLYVFLIVCSSSFGLLLCW